MLLSFIVSSREDPYWNLAVEHYLMRYSDPERMTFYLWRNARTVVIGRHQNPYVECRVDLLREEGGHLLRRTTGGGAVYHDGGNLNFSFVVPVTEYDIDRQFAVVKRALGCYGLHAECSGRNDLLVDGSQNADLDQSESGTANPQLRKFSGNAFSKGRSHHLHHGTLLIAGNMSDMQRYLMPSKTKLAKHGVSSVQSRVVNLSELADITVENIQPYLTEACEQVYGLQGEWVDFDSLCDDPRVRELHDLYISDAWLTDGWQDFATTARSHFDWGDVALSLQVQDGVIQDIRIATDALDIESIDRLQQLLLHQSLDRRPMVSPDIDGAMSRDLLSLLYPTEQ